MFNGQKNNHPLLLRKRRRRLTCRVRTAEKRVLRKRSEFPANFEQNAKIRHVVIGILPCVIITCLNQDANMAKNANSDTTMLRRRPARSRRKGSAKGSVAVLKKKSKLWLCTSRFLSEEVHSIRKVRKMGSNASAGDTVKFSGWDLAPNQNSGKKRATSRSYPKV